MPAITDLRGRIVRDSRGSKTVEVEVTADGKFTGRASAPSGASVGIHEATGFPGSPEACLSVLRDNAPRFSGADPSSLEAVHAALREMDPTPKYESCGGGVAFAVTLASADAAAKALGEPLFRILSDREPKLPRPLGNVLGGGAHAGPGTPDIQEILVCATGAKTAEEAVEANVRVHAQLGRDLTKDPSFTGGRGDEGGWAPRMRSEDALEAAARALESCGYELGREVSLGIDFAASTMWKGGKYEYSRDGASRSPGEQEDFVVGLAEKFKVVYAEDPVHEEDFEGMARITGRLPRAMVGRRRPNRDQRGHPRKGRGLGLVQRRHTKGQPGRQPARRHGVRLGRAEARRRHRHVPPLRRDLRSAHSARGGGRRLGHAKVGHSRRRARGKGQRAAPALRA